MRFNTPFYVIACAAGISSYLLFYFQDEITNLAKSSDLCDGHTYNIIQWIFPKIIFRCSLLNDAMMRDYPGVNVMVVVDIWITFCCVLSLIFSIWKLKSITERDLFEYLTILREKERNEFSRGSPRIRVKSSIHFRIRTAMRLHAFVFIFFLGLIFVYSPAISDGSRLGFVSLLASYGTGVLAHGIGSVIPAYCLFYSIFSFRLLREFL